ncbi:MAG: TRAP transporter small permease [Thermodesulfobacteriota bacterium]|nr:TRAP transporter small permease [Thermodesulfobacteriota bacterium]
MSNKPDHSYFTKVQVFLYRVENGILVVLLLSMLLMAVLQILMRNLFESGIVWGDILVRVLVLWVGLVGAMVASRHGNHININILSRYLPERAGSIVKSACEFFTAAVCSVAAFYTLRFVKIEFAEGGMAFAQMPIWVCEAIIPVAFIVISLRYLILSIITFSKIIKSTS